MSRSSKNVFQGAAAAPQKAKQTGPLKRKRPSPLSIRVSAEERALLESWAGDQPVGTYVRAQLFGKEANQHKRKVPRRKNMNYEILGRLLAALGKSELATALCLLAVAAESGSVVIDRDSKAKLNTACADVRAMRLLLITALGLKPGGKT